MKYVFSWFVVVCTLLSLASPAMASEPTPDVQVMRISASDGAAVIRVDGGKLQVVKKGSKLEGLGKIQDIEEKKLTLNVMTPKGRETWIITQEKDDQHLEKINHYAPQMALMLAPGQTIMNPEAAEMTLRQSPQEGATVELDNVESITLPDEARAQQPKQE